MTSFNNYSLHMQVNSNKDIKSMIPKGCIIFCVEKGLLEKYTILSISSIQKFGGFLSHYDIYCFQPRREFPVSKNTKTALAKLGATFIDTPLNIKHRYYPIANKSIVCDYMARKYKYDQYIFLDRVFCQF